MADANGRHHGAPTVGENDAENEGGSEEEEEEDYDSEEDDSEEDGITSMPQLKTPFEQPPRRHPGTRPPPPPTASFMLRPERAPRVPEVPLPQLGERRSRSSARSSLRASSHTSRSSIVPRPPSIAPSMASRSPPLAADDDLADIDDGGLVARRRRCQRWPTTGRRRRGGLIVSVATAVAVTAARGAAQADPSKGGRYRGAASRQGCERRCEPECRSAREQRHGRAALLRTMNEAEHSN